MNEIGTLAGFGARMPGVLSFVTPVFRTPSLRLSAQVSGDDGIVSTFREVPAGEGFMAAASPLFLTTGQQRMYAFQTTEVEIVSGTANALAWFLREATESASDFLAIHPRTGAAIKRFLEMEKCVPRRSADLNVFILRRSRGRTGAFKLAEMRSVGTKLQEVTNEEFEKTLSRSVISALKREHASGLGLHSEARERVRSLVDPRGADGRRSAAKVASRVLQKLGRQARNGKSDNHLLCMRCGLSMVIDYPSQEGTASLLGLVATLVHASRNKPTVLQSNMLDIGIEVLADHLDRLSFPEEETTHLQLAILFQEMQATRQANEHTKDTMRRLRERSHETQYIPKGGELEWCSEMDVKNLKFDEIATGAEDDRVSS